MSTKVGFVPPYVFDQLSRVDHANSHMWIESASQARKILKEKSQESFANAQRRNERHSLPIDYTPQVTIITNRKQPGEDEKNAYKNGTATLKFLWEKFGRKSFDNQGSKLKIYVHDQGSPNNAYWKGDDTVHIGDSDQPEYTTFATDPDIMAHEIEHGVIKYSARFEYRGESGALNESCADVLGSMVKQYLLNQKAYQADWLIGDQFVKDIGRVQALRSMKAPGTAYEFDENNKDLQVDHMSNYNNTTRDSGGVHINSGIPNKAFYLFAMAFPDHYSWEIAGQVWYKAVDHCNPTTGFAQFAEITVNVPIDLFSKASAEISNAAFKAWLQVGVLSYGIPRNIPTVSLPILAPMHHSSDRKHKVRYIPPHDEEDAQPGCFCQ